MIKFYLLLLLIVFKTFSYKLFRIIPKIQHHLDLLSNFESTNITDYHNYMYWKEPSGLENPIDLMVSTVKLNDFQDFINTTGMEFQVMIEDVEKLLNKKESRVGRSADRLHLNYMSLEEIYSWLKSAARKYPAKLQLVTAGYSYEARPIVGAKITNGNYSKMGVFIEAGIHAREWISHATAIYLINELLTSTDPRIISLANTYNWYIFPVLNPDGYKFTHEQPNSIHHRLWRKNRRDCGTDLNRNWGLRWTRNSDYPCSETYPGKRAFSETETSYFSNYLTSIRNEIQYYIALHSYSQLLSFPYGFTNYPVDSYSQHLRKASKAAQAIAARYGTRYKVGSISQFFGKSTGSSIDWVKGSLGIPQVFVYELRDTGNYGFLLPPSQIIPNGQEFLDSLITLLAS